MLYLHFKCFNSNTACCSFLNVKICIQIMFVFSNSTNKPKCSSQDWFKPEIYDEFFFSYYHEVLYFISFLVSFLLPLQPILQCFYYVYIRLHKFFIKIPLRFGYSLLSIPFHFLELQQIFFHHWTFYRDMFSVSKSWYL